MVEGTNGATSLCGMSANGTAAKLAGVVSEEITRKVDRMITCRYLSKQGNRATYLIRNLPK